MFAAKRALFTALTALTATGQPLEGVQVSYDWPGRGVARKCVYGGGIRVMQDDAVAESGVMTYEKASIGLYVRVLEPGKAVVDSDTTAESIGEQIGGYFAANPHLVGNLSVARIRGLQADYAHPPDGANVATAETIVAYQVEIQSFLSMV